MKLKGLTELSYLSDPMSDKEKKDFANSVVHKLYL